MPPLPSQESTGVSRPFIWTLVATGWCILFFTTLDVREANLDDVAFQQIVNNGTIWQYIRDWGPIQGRHYGIFAFGPIWALDSLSNPVAFQLARLGLVALSLTVVSRLVARLAQTAWVTPLWWLLWIGCLQIPPTFYGLLSYPQMHVGLIFVLAGAILYLRSIEEANVWTAWCSAGLFFLGLQFNEAFLAFGFLYLALWYLRSGRASEKPMITWLLPVAAAWFSYLAIYFWYRATHHAPVAYEGTRAGGDMAGIVQYVLRYSASSLPGFELVIDRDLTHSALRSTSDILHRLQTMKSLDVAWAAAIAIGAATAVYFARWNRTFNDAWRAALILALTGIFFLSMPAVSAKYQVFAYRRLYPHAYNFITVHFAWAAVAVLLCAAAQSLRDRARGLAALSIAAGISVGAICLVSQITNRLALEEIRAVVYPTETRR